MFAEVFNKKQIEKDYSYENSIPTPLETLPEDYLWYLHNYGSRTIRNMEFQVLLKDDEHELAIAIENGNLKIL